MQTQEKVRRRHPWQGAYTRVADIRGGFAGICMYIGHKLAARFYHTWRAAHLSHVRNKLRIALSGYVSHCSQEELANREFASEKATLAGIRCQGQRHAGGLVVSRRTRVCIRNGLGRNMCQKATV
jgi:hypothetical protein